MKDLFSEEGVMDAIHWNVWKLATIGIAVMITTVLVTGLVVANLNKPAPQPPPAVAQQSPANPTRTPARSEPRQPAARRGPSTSDVVEKALVGGALGAGVGAAGGAIAGGGHGAGKGAAIGGIVGAAAGTLYGLNQK